MRFISLWESLLLFSKRKALSIRCTLTLLFLCSMACLNPRYYRYRDAYSGEERICAIPCRHCASCLHAEHDAINVRVRETAKAYDSFIYDTLTFSNESMDWLDWSEELSIAHDNLPKRARRILDRYYPNGCVPVFPKSIFSQWIKRGREALRYKYGDDYKSPKFVCCMEYGPKSSRPHCHLIMWGVSFADYNKYFGKPWRETYGFTKTKYRSARSKDITKDLECIASYISKYVNKGSFESPLVKLGLQPKCWRQLSHGIGEEYLDRCKSKFEFLYTPIANSYRNTSFFTYKPWYDLYKQAYVPYRVNSQRVWIPRQRLLCIGKEELSSLSVYHDRSGYPHRLPRYYRDKLIGYDPTLLKYEVQTALYKDAVKRSYQEASEFATSVGCVGADKLSTEAEVLGLLGIINPVLPYQYLSQQKNKRELREAGYKVKLKNHYFRPCSLPSGDLNL